MTDKFQKDADFKAAFDGKLAEIKRPFPPDFEPLKRLSGGSADAADQIATELQQHALHTLATEAPTEVDKGTSIEHIRDSLVDWTGPAADAFRAYLRTLEQCLKAQHDFLMALLGIIECKRDLHYAKREGILQILDQAIENEAIQAEQTWRDGLSNAVGSYLAVEKALLTGAGPVGAAAEVMGLLGGYIAQQLASPGYKVEVPVDMRGYDDEALLEATGQLDGYVTEEQTQINKGLGKLLDLRDSFGERLIPPEPGKLPG